MGQDPENLKSESGADGITWDLSDLYESPSDPELAADRKAVLELAGDFSGRYRNRVADLDPEEFFVCLKEYEEIIGLLRKIGSYSNLIWSTDTENPQLGKLVQEATELASEVNQKMVFFDVEWLKLDEEAAALLIDSSELKPFRHYLIVSRGYREHTLDEGQEKVMSAKGVTGRSAWVRYFDQTLGASRYLLDGEELTQQQVLGMLQSGDRDLRHRAHASLTETLQSLNRTLTYVFNTVLADKSVNDRLRNYEHWLDARNLSNQIDNESVSALTTAVTDAYPLAQRYYRLKRKLLGYEELFDYDRYAPISQIERRIGWAEARETVLSSFGAFDPAMEEIATLFFEKRWIDAAIRPGKRGGAYSASTAAAYHPYIFLNYDGRLRDVQTLAHELGHGVHQYLARDRGELLSSTPLTTAETASVFAEMLVFEKLMRSLEDPADKLALLTGKIDDTIATVFRQISMNRFEEAIHARRRESGELTSGEFAEIWTESQEALYGDSVTLTDDYKLWWSYIPHFLHTPGYVYAYAFGELLVLALYKAYREGLPDFESRYLELLSAGGSDWPHRLLSSLGLDIRDPGFWLQGLEIFAEMVGEAEQLATQIEKGR